jgi:predicted short-subunit dehydrogenase-like oxidoreductase (DUF2520 family)
MERLYFVGPGRMGIALGYALVQADAVDSLTYCGRRPEPPSHPLFNQGLARYVYGIERPEPGTTALFLTVPDDALAETAEHVAAQGEAPEGCAAFHVSGALSTEPLGPLHVRKYAVGSFHPLQAVTNFLSSSERIPGSAVAIAGEPQAVKTAHRIASALGCPPMQIAVKQRPLYHAAAVLASNNLAALIGIAAELLIEAGVPPDEAIPALLPLARGTLANIDEVGLQKALTGPVARGDTETVGLHLRRLDPAAQRMYATLGDELLSLVEKAGGDEEAISTMRKLFEVHI